MLMFAPWTVHPVLLRSHRSACRAWRTLRILLAVIALPAVTPAGKSSRSRLNPLPERDGSCVDNGRTLVMPLQGLRSRKKPHGASFSPHTGSVVVQSDALGVVAKRCYALWSKTRRIAFGSGIGHPIGRPPRGLRAFPGGMRDSSDFPVSPTTTVVSELPTFPEQHPREPERGRARLRAAAPEAMGAARAARVARGARMLNAALICVVAGNVMVVGVEGVNLIPRIVGAVVSALIWIAAYRAARRDVTFARLSALARSIYQARAVATGALLTGAAAYFIPWLQLAPERVLITAAAIFVVAAVWGGITTRLLGGVHVHRTLLIGDGEQVGRFVREFADDPHPGYQIVGLLTDRTDDDDALMGEDTAIRQIAEMFDGASADLGGVPILGDVDDLEAVLAAEAIDTVVVSVRRNRLQVFARLSAWGGNITVQELPAFSERVFGRVPIDVINAAWFMHMIHPFYRPYSRAVKRAVDIAAAIGIGVASLPLLPLCAALVKLTSRGPMLYSQVRVGERGREFRIYKFRTMRTDAEAAGAQWAQRNDPRVTRAGSFMRSTRLDELPQLWNILRGQMSFVGPRPERPEFVGELEAKLPYYQRRHLVKPGLTGWAQVRHGYADTVDAAAFKLGYELYYLKHQSLFLDVVILVETVRVVLMRFGSR